MYTRLLFSLFLFSLFVPELNEPFVYFKSFCVYVCGCECVREIRYSVCIISGETILARKNLIFCGADINLDYRTSAFGFCVVLFFFFKEAGHLFSLPSLWPTGIGLAI